MPSTFLKACFRPIFAMHASMKVLNKSNNLRFLESPLRDGGPGQPKARANPHDWSPWQTRHCLVGRPSNVLAPAGKARAATIKSEEFCRESQRVRPFWPRQDGGDFMSAVAYKNNGYQALTDEKYRYSSSSSRALITKDKVETQGSVVYCCSATSFVGPPRSDQYRGCQLTMCILPVIGTAVNRR